MRDAHSKLSAAGHEELAKARQMLSILPQSIALTFCITSFKSFALVMFSPTHRYFCDSMTLFTIGHYSGIVLFFPNSSMCLQNATLTTTTV